MYGRGGNRGGGNRVCDFFLQGRCKFGDNCKYEHPGSQSGSGGNRFSALSGQGGARGRQSDGKDTLPYNLNKEIIVADLRNERPIWPFSAYGPGKDAPRQLFGGLPLEQSPEEMRVSFYLAQAAGNTQPAIQQEETLYLAMNQQIEKVLSDPDGAVKYIIDGENEHPNRREMTKVSGQSDQSKPVNPFSSATNASGFGQASGGGSGFGQPSNTLGSGVTQHSAFGQPSQVGGSTFGAPSTLGSGIMQSSAFGQPSQVGGSAFGAPSTLGQAKPAFGQTSQPTNPFSAQSNTSPFGQTRPVTVLGHLHPASGQETQPCNTFACHHPAPSTFGQPTQSTGISPFAPASVAASHQHLLPSASPFGVAIQQQASPSAQTSQTDSAQNPFSSASQSSASPFAQNGGQQRQQSSQIQANTSAVKSSFTPSHTHPGQAAAGVRPVPLGDTGGTATPALSSYAQRSGDQLRSWHGKPVTFDGPDAFYSKTGNIHDAASLDRIWHAGGPPAGSPYTAETDEMYEKAGSGLEQQYLTCAEQGRFEGAIPLIAPKRAWTRYDV